MASWREWRWRALVAVGLPPIALVLTFPFLHTVMTVYNEPESPVAAFLFAAFLGLVPGIAIARLVRNRWPFALAVALSVVAAIVVAWQVASTDDGQAGLAVLGLPVFMGGALAVALIADAIMRSIGRTSVD